MARMNILCFVVWPFTFQNSKIPAKNCKTWRVTRQNKELAFLPYLRWRNCKTSKIDFVTCNQEEPQAQHAGLTSYKDFQWRKTDVEMVSKSVPALVLTGCIGIKFILPNLHSQRFCSNALITQLSWCASKNANIKKISPDVHVMSSTTKQCWTDVKKESIALHSSLLPSFMSSFGSTILSQLTVTWSTLYISALIYCLVCALPRQDWVQWWRELRGALERAAWSIGGQRYQPDSVRHLTVANVGTQMVFDILKYPLCHVALQGTVLSVHGGEMGLCMECAKRQVQPLYGIIVDGKATSAS